MTYYTGSSFTVEVEAQLDKRFFILHAAGINDNKQSIIFPGALSCGKTILTLGFVQKGFKFSSDDIVLIDRQTYEVYPYPRLLNIREDSAQIVRKLGYKLDLDSQSEIAGEKRWFLDLSQHVANKFSPKYIISPQGFDSEAKLEPISKTQAAVKLLENCYHPITPLNSVINLVANFESAVGLVRNARCFKLICGEPEDTIDLILATIRKC